MAQETEFISIEQALGEVHKMGFTDCTLTYMQRMARERVLPFFKEGKRLYIKRDQLREHYEIKAVKAEQEVKRRR